MLSYRQHTEIFVPQVEPDAHSFHPEPHPYDILFAEERNLGVDMLGETVVTEAAGKVLVLHLPTLTSRTKCFTLVFELRNLWVL